MNFQAYPFGPDRPSDVTLEIALTDTIEAAGRRLTLFGRLLDEREELHLEQARVEQAASPEGTARVAGV
jgi:hypothetical protein